MDFKTKPLAENLTGTRRVTKIAICGGIRKLQPGKSFNDLYEGLNIIE